MRGWTLLGLLLLSACSARRGVSSSERDGLTLAFAWPDGVALTATLEDRVERVRQHGRVEVRELRGSVPMTVRAHSEGVAIEVGRADLHQVRIDGRDISDDVAGAIALFDASFPSIVARSDGAFHALLDPRAAVEALRTGLAQAFSGFEVPPAVQQTFDELSVEPVRRRAAADWYALVAAWPGAWTRGAERVEIVVERVDGEPDMAIEVSRAWLGRAPCGPEDPDRSCVQMRLRRAPTAEALDAWRASLVESYGRRSPVTVEVAERTEEHTLLLHPDTLLPVRVERIASTRAVLRRADGAVFSPLDKQERRIVRYTGVASGAGPQVAP